MLLGPNTGLGHNSIVFMIESQVQLRPELPAPALGGARRDAIEVAARRAAPLQRPAPAPRCARAVWNEGGCKSWYLDEHGVNRTLWPGFTFEYWARTRRARRREYDLSR